MSSSNEEPGVPIVDVLWAIQPVGEELSHGKVLFAGSEKPVFVRLPSFYPGIFWKLNDRGYPTAALKVKKVSRRYVFEVVNKKSVSWPLDGKDEPGLWEDHDWMDDGILFHLCRNAWKTEKELSALIPTQKSTSPQTLMLYPAAANNNNNLPPFGTVQVVSNHREAARRLQDACERLASITVVLRLEAISDDDFFVTPEPWVFDRISKQTGHARVALLHPFISFGDVSDLAPGTRVVALMCDEATLDTMTFLLKSLPPSIHLAVLLNTVPRVEVHHRTHGSPRCVPELLCGLYGRPEGRKPLPIVSVNSSKMLHLQMNKARARNIPCFNVVSSPTSDTSIHEGETVYHSKIGMLLCVSTTSRGFATFKPRLATKRRRGMVLLKNGQFSATVPTDSPYLFKVSAHPAFVPRAGKFFRLRAHGSAEDRPDTLQHA